MYMKQFTSTDGLPSSTVNDVIQDDEGFIWFATDHGVSRFDGHHFTNFTAEDGIADDEVIRLGKDHESRIWFLGFNGRASFYSGGKFYDEKNSPIAAQTQLSSAFTKFLISKNGTVYLVSLTDGFIRVDADRVKKFSRDTLLKAGISYFNGLRSVKLDTSGHLWIFTVDSIYVFRSGATTVSKFSQNQFPDKMVFCSFLSDGSFIIPANGKIIRHSGNETDSVTGLMLNPLIDYVSLEQDGNNNLWLMTTMGTYLFRNKIFDRQHQAKILDGKFCGHVFTDREGNTWLTPLRDGVYMIPSLDVQFLNTLTGLANNNVLVLADHPQGVIAGFANGEVQLIQNKDHSVTLQSPVAIGSYMVDIFPGEKNRWLFLTNAEVISGDEHFKIIERKSANWAKSYFQRDDGSLLIGGGFLLSSLQNGKLTALYKFPRENRIYSIAEDKQKVIWLGTEEGLYSFQDSTMKFFGEKFPLTKGRINDLEFDEQGRLWIASSRNGLLLMEGSQVRSLFPPDKKIAGQKIFIDPDGSIYSGTDKGIFILKESVNKKGNFQVISIRKSDGLASEKINTLLVKDGMIWIGTDEGLQIFPLDKKLQQVSSIPIRLTAFTINGKSFSPDSTLNLNYQDNNIHLSFTGISFREPQSVIYRYKIQSGDTAWQYTSNSSLDLPELSPGKYQLTVQAGTSKSNWSSSPLLLSFTIHAPFWKTWWFYLAVVVAGALSGFLIFRYRYLTRVNEEEQKRKSVEAELAALRAQMNPHFIFNSLNAIQDFIFQHKTEEANEYLTKFAKLIRAILNQSRKKFVTIDEECELLQMYLELESLRFNQAFVWEMKMGKEIIFSEMMIPSMLLQPVVENSIKHGFKNLKQKGFLKISFEKENGFIRCEVEDNGMGRAAAQHADGNSLALSITQERLTILNQSLDQWCTMEVIDLFNDGLAVGLKTVFRFPANINQ